MKHEFDQELHKYVYETRTHVIDRETMTTISMKQGRNRSFVDISDNCAGMQVLDSLKDLGKRISDRYNSTASADNFLGFDNRFKLVILCEKKDIIVYFDLVDIEY